MNEKIVNELQQIQDAHGGLLRPVDVVAFARNPETALHSKFEWDDSKAAEEHRLWQARQVISVHVTVLPNTEEPVRAYVSLQADRSAPGGGYRSIRDVMTDAEYRKALVRQWLKESQISRQKYNTIKELAPVFEAMEAAEEILSIQIAEEEAA